MSILRWKIDKLPPNLSLESRTIDPILELKSTLLHVRGARLRLQNKTVKGMQAGRGGRINVVTLKRA